MKENTEKKAEDLKQILNELIQYGEDLKESLTDTRDHLKHMNTLNTGSILLMIAFLTKVFENPKGKWIVLISIIAFVTSLLCSLFAMHQTIEISTLMNSLKQNALSGNFDNYNRENKHLLRRINRWKFGEVTSNIMFCIGIITLVGFAMYNFL